MGKVTKNKIDQLKVLAEGHKFKILYDPSVDIIESFLEAKPNYYILNKDTGMIEGSVMSEYSARRAHSMAEQLCKEEEIVGSACSSPGETTH